MELEVGSTYSTKAMRDFFGVSEDQWKKKKNKLLENFSYYYEYEVEYSGRKINYHIIKKIGEYQPIPTKGEKRDSIYEKGIIDVISEDNVQTAANVARRLAAEDDDVISLNHAPGTVYEYTRVKMRNMFGTTVNEGGSKGMIIDKVWCRLNAEFNYYEEMSQEAINEFFAMYDSYRADNKRYELRIFNDYQNGLITKQEMYERVGEEAFNCYQQARSEFNKKYGYYPIKVPVYELSAF